MKHWNFSGLIWPKVLGFDHFKPLAEPSLLVLATDKVDLRQGIEAVGDGLDSRKEKEVSGIGLSYSKHGNLMQPVPFMSFCSNSLRIT